MTVRSRAVDVERFRANSRETCADRVVAEEPLEIRLGFAADGQRQTRVVAITMRTPGDDAELATGFLFSEGIIHAPEDVAIVKPCDGDNTIRVELEDGVDVDLGPLERHFYMTSSCGVCGKASLEALHVKGVRSLPAARGLFDRDVLVSVPDKLRDAQATFDETGGLHAAAVFDATGELIVVREDVGRHNAVDKVLGSLFAARRLPAGDLGLMVSGRASFELTQKALVAGIPLIAAVSAPSSLAVELAQEFNVTLVGFLRDDTFNVYAAKERIRQ